MFIKVSASGAGILFGALSGSLKMNWPLHAGDLLGRAFLYSQINCTRLAIIVLDYSSTKGIEL